MTSSLYIHIYLIINTCRMYTYIKAIGIVYSSETIKISEGRGSKIPLVVTNQFYPKQFIIIIII